MPGGKEDVFDRNLVARADFVDFFQRFSIDKLVTVCQTCNQYYLLCSRHCSPTGMETECTCHRYRLIFTAGACIRFEERVAGIGIVHGNSDVYQIAIPVTTAIDSVGRRRSKHRAEVLAAIEGLDAIAVADLAEGSSLSDVEPSNKDPCSSSRPGRKEWMITTDSEYVVKIMTEDLPVWKVSL